SLRVAAQIDRVRQTIGQEERRTAEEFCKSLHEGALFFIMPKRKREFQDSVLRTSINPRRVPVVTCGGSQKNGSPKGIRTPVSAVRGRRPGPARRWDHRRKM